jgi:hypothetical protein
MSKSDIKGTSPPARDVMKDLQGERRPGRVPRQASKQKFTDPNVSYGEIEKRIATALGIQDPDFLESFLRQAICAAELGEPSDDLEVNFLLSVIDAVLSNGDAAKGMIAAQFGVVDVQIMRLARVINRTIDPIELDILGRLFNNLLRTSVAQYHALKENRSGVNVGHVSVNEGGQAIVGSVTHNQSEATAEKHAPTQPLLTDAKIVPMPIIEDDKERDAVALSVNRQVKKPRKKWQANTRAIPHPCWQVHVAAPRRAQESLAGLRRSAEGGAAECTVERQSRVLHLKTKMHFAMEPIHGNRSRNIGVCVIS